MATWLRLAAAWPYAVTTAGSHGMAAWVNYLSLRLHPWLLHPQQLQRLGCLDGSMGPQSHGQTMDGWFVPFDEKARSLFCPNISGLV